MASGGESRHGNRRPTEAAMSPTLRRSRTAGTELPPDPFDESDESSRPADGPVWASLRRPSPRNVVIAVVAAIVAFAIGAAVVLSRPATYYSQSTLLIDNPSQLAAAADEGTIAKLSGLRAKYAALVHTPAIAGPVARRLDIPVGEVYGSANTFLGLQSLVLVSGATADKPAKAQRIAQAVADEISRYVRDEHVRFHVPLPQRFTITVVNKAYPGQKSSPTRRHAATVGLISGGLVLAGLYVLLELIAARRPRD